jgi:hypothetical protein
MLVALACGSAIPPPIPVSAAPPVPCTWTPGPASEFKVLTYNVGLAPGLVPLSTPRIPHVAKAIADSDADVICLQEAWKPDAIEALRAVTGATPDRFFVGDTAGENEDRDDQCGSGHLNALAACARKYCSGVPDEDMALCALENCKASGIRLYLFHRSCLNCVVSQVGNGIDEIRQTCTDRPSSRVYGGGNGIVMISRHPLLDREVVRLRSSNANRVALLARVEVPGRGSVQVGCTHLSAPAPTSPSHPDFDSWDEEKTSQLKDAMDALERRGPGQPHILALDGNFGPGYGSVILPSDPQLWNYAQRRGYWSIGAALMDPPLCTSCASNPLRKRNPRNYMLDHILIHKGSCGNAFVPTAVRRMFVDPVTVDAYGKRWRTTLSDHYGIEATFGF